MKPVKFVCMACAMLMLAGMVRAECNPAIEPVTPGSRFNLSSDGTVTDNQTGLIWMRCSLGQKWNGSGCDGEPERYSWSAALTAAETTTFAGKADWRLPDVKQLASIVELACVNPSINTQLFPGTASDEYWSSSPNVNGIQGAWSVDFDDGEVHTYSNTAWHLRLLRGGL